MPVLLLIVKARGAPIRYYRGDLVGTRGDLVGTRGDLVGTSWGRQGDAHKGMVGGMVSFATRQTPIIHGNSPACRGIIINLGGLTGG